MLLLLLACTASPEDSSKPCSTPTLWYADADADGFGDAEAATEACDAPAGAVSNADDCDDANAVTSPAGTEITYDGADNDCDAATPDDDLDADGYALAEDCDDADAAVSPAGAEVAYDGVDNDCDAATPDDDLDADGYPLAEDCDDTNAAVSPSVSEVNNDGIDNDCDSSTPNNNISLSAADAQYTAEAANDGAGMVVAGAGDINADGYADCLVGAYKNDGGGPDAGAVYLLLGGTTPTSASLATASARYMGAAGSRAGTSVMWAGDVNGDGFDDFFTGAPYDDVEGTDAGAAHLVLGSASPTASSFSSAEATFTGVATYNYAGMAVSGAGDVNSDGYMDLLVGAPYNGDGGSYSGSAYLILGSASPTSAGLADASAQYTGLTNSDFAGYALARVGDFNADGFDDFTIGAYKNDAGGTDAGAAFLILGSSAPTSTDLSLADAQYSGKQMSDQAGIAVEGAGDVNGDGYADFLIGATGNDDAHGDAGAVYLILGTPFVSTISLASADAQYTGEARSDGAGITVGTAGDVNLDGFADFLVGAIYNDNGGSDAGAAYMILGSSAPASMSLSDADALYAGESSDDYVGSSVANAGDVDGDGYEETIIGAIFNGDAGAYAGAAYIVSYMPE